MKLCVMHPDFKFGKGLRLVHVCKDLQGIIPAQAVVGSSPYENTESRFPAIGHFIYKGVFRKLTVMVNACFSCSGERN